MIYVYVLIVNNHLKINCRPIVLSTIYLSKNYIIHITAHNNGPKQKCFNNLIEQIVKN